MTTTNNPQRISPVLISRLYKRIAAEEARWQQSGYDDRTGSISILSAVQHLKNQAFDLNPSDPTELEALIQYAGNVAVWMFRRRAKQRYMRRKVRGIADVPLNFSLASPTQGAREVETELPSDDIISHTFSYVDMLRAAGIKTPIAYACVRRFEGADWEDVQAELADSGHVVQEGTLRQWYSRHKDHCRAVIRDEYRSLDA